LLFINLYLSIDRHGAAVYHSRKREQESIMAPQPITENTLFYGDNLDILRQYLPDNSVDLIYLDPPFNSSRSYNVLFKDEHGIESEAHLTFSNPNPNRQFEWRGTKPPAHRSWGASLEQLEQWYAEGRILLKKDGTPRLDGLKVYLEETKLHNRAQVKMPPQHAQKTGKE
jgi:hypothetical protein